MGEPEEGTGGRVPEGPQEVTRRRFLGYGSGLLSVVIGVALGIPLVRFFVGDAFAKREPRWLELGLMREVGGDSPTLFRTSYLDTDGWRQTTRREAMYAVRQNSTDVIVLSNACTHLGCPVHWDEDSRLFLCPCHNGGFSPDGAVVKGPAPRPLDRVEHKVEDGVLYVQVGRA